MIFCGICQGTIDRDAEVKAHIVSICPGCRQRLAQELPGERPIVAVFKNLHPISQDGFSAFDGRLQLNSVPRAEQSGVRVGKDLHRGRTGADSALDSRLGLWPATR
jgi:hypothetical protein